MPLPPVKLPEKLLLEIYKDLLQGATRKFGDAFSVMADSMIAGRTKSREELALDYLRGEAGSEARRRLAAEAIGRIPPERRVFPAPQIAGPIFRDSEFELPDTPIWELWSQLLSRACDSDRVNEAHPAFPGIISQLSSQEAGLLRLIWESRIIDALKYETTSWSEGDNQIMEYAADPAWEERLGFFPDFHFGIEHLSQLALIDVIGNGGIYSTSDDGRDIVVVTYTCRMSFWGSAFMRSVREPIEQAQF